MPRAWREWRWSHWARVMRIGIFPAERAAKQVIGQRREHDSEKPEQAGDHPQRAHEKRRRAQSLHAAYSNAAAAAVNP